MPYLIGVLVAALAIFLIYHSGRRSGYSAGRLDERREWSTKIRKRDD